jgi:chorismate mutase/L-amino acid N-acyltransferase YncA
VAPTEAQDLVLRPAEAADRDAIGALYAETRAAAVPAMPAALHTVAEDCAFFGRLLASGAEGWLAEETGEQVGFLVLQGDWLHSLYVHPRSAGRGVGGALLELAKARRPGGFCLWVFESNAAARAFYEHHGLVTLEHTDGSGNEERSPDLRMAWPGADPLAFYRRLIDEVDTELGDLLARRVALTRVVQQHKAVQAPAPRDPLREAEIAAAMAARAPELGEERLSRIVHAIITESLDAALAERR